MPGSWPQQDHPRLTASNCSITSPILNRYNCIAWAAGDNKRNWWPDLDGFGYWPPGCTRALTTAAFIQAFGTLGYLPCRDGLLEANNQKVAIFATRGLMGNVPTHAALQLPDGTWTSKMGPLEDICHQNVDGVGGPVYGDVICYLARQREQGSTVAAVLR
jgi:hypothetical protein